MEGTSPDYSDFWSEVAQSVSVIRVTTILHNTHCAPSVGANCVMRGGANTSCESSKIVEQTSLPAVFSLLGTKLTPNREARHDFAECLDAHV
jgi:hypothetical protein